MLTETLQAGPAPPPMSMPPWLEWSMPPMAMSVPEAMAAEAVVVMCMSWSMVVDMSISI